MLLLFALELLLEYLYGIGIYKPPIFFIELDVLL